MEYYLGLNSKEVLSCAIACVNLEDIMLVK